MQITSPEKILNITGIGNFNFQIFLLLLQINFFYMPLYVVGSITEYFADILVLDGQPLKYSTTHIHTYKLGYPLWTYHDEN